MPVMTITSPATSEVRSSRFTRIRPAVEVLEAVRDLLAVAEVVRELVAQVALAHDLERAHADVGVEVQLRRAPAGAGASSRVGDVDAVARRGRAPPSRRRRSARPTTRTRRSGTYTTASPSPTSTARFVVWSCGQVDVAQVDDQLADAELVAVVAAARSCSGGSCGRRRRRRGRCRPPTTMPSGSTSTSAGTISQRAPPTNAVPTSAKPATTARMAIDHAAAQGSRKSDADGRADGGDADERGERDPRRPCGRGRRSTLPPSAAPEQDTGQPDQPEDEQPARRRRAGGLRNVTSRQPEHHRPGDRHGLAVPTGRSLPSDGHEREQAEVGEHADPAGEGEHDEADPEEDRVDAEVAAEAAGDAADDRVGARAREAAWLGGRSLVGSLGRGLVVHGGNIAAGGRAFHWG